MIYRTGVSLIIAVASILALSCSKGNSQPEVKQPVDTVKVSLLKPEKADNNVVAHRGAYKATGNPDNSIAAMKAAIQLKCYASECDIHLTKDYKVVVYHDDKFHGLVFKDAAYEELNAAGRLANGEKLPLLEDFIDAALEGGTTKLWIDVKSLDNQYGGNEWSAQAGEYAAKIIRSKQAQHYVEFIAGRIDVLRRCIAAAKNEWPCAYMNQEYTPQQFSNEGFIWANLPIGAFYTSASNNHPALIKEFKDKNIRVSTYNADTEEQMNWFLNQDLYAICTNYPEKLLQLIRGN